MTESKISLAQASYNAALLDVIVDHLNNVISHAVNSGMVVSVAVLETQFANQADPTPSISIRATVLPSAVSRGTG